jgi:hypothetical protein
MFVDACRAQGAKQVSTAARDAFDSYMKACMSFAALSAVTAMKNARRIRVEPADIPSGE